MRYIDNVSEVIDFSGETPVTVVSNNVRTYLNQPTVIPHCPGRQSCRCCRSACDIFRREEDFHDNCRAREDCRQQKLLARRLRNKPGLPQRQNRLRLLRLRVLLSLPLQLAFLIKKLSDKSRRAFFEIWRKSIFTRVARINGQTNLFRRQCATSRRA